MRHADKSCGIVSNCDVQHEKKRQVHQSKAKYTGKSRIGLKGDRRVHPGVHVRY